MVGTVYNYDRVKGYGFITPDTEDAPNYFVHFRSIQAIASKRYLKVGERVEFHPSEDADGRPRAENVQKLEAVQS